MCLFCSIFVQIPPYYRPPTKLREGNVFSRVYPPGAHATITDDALDLPIEGPLCTGPLLVLPSSAIEAHMVRKRAIRILLECFLVPTESYI